MVKVVLKKIDIQNFKGFAKATKFFDPTREVIQAENGAGKSTFYDAFRWALCVGTDADIVPMIDNKEITGLETYVEVNLQVNDLEYTLKRVQVEKWKTDKYTNERKKEGNECKYYFDGIECTKRDYTEKVNNLFAAKGVDLQMLIRKEYFNSDAFDWRNRRKILFDLCRIDDVVATLADSPKYDLISNDIKKGISTSELKKRYVKERNGYKQQQDKNQIIIEEKATEIARYSDYDFDALKAEKDKLLKHLSDLQVKNRDEQMSEALSLKVKEAQRLTDELSKLQIAEINARKERSKALTEKLNELNKIKNEGDKYKREIAETEDEIIDLKEKLDELDKKVFEGDTVCSLCGQPLPAEKIETAKADFESHIKAEKAKLKNELKEKQNKLDALNAKIEPLREQYKQLANEYNALNSENSTQQPNPAIAELEQKITALQAEIRDIKSKDAKEEIKKLISETQEKISEIDAKLGYQKVIADMKARVAELKNENADLADKIAECYKKEERLAQFMFEQVKLVNDTVNALFSNGVSFALFKELYKGGEGGLEEDCTCMFNGKRYTALSTGERYYADLEVIKTLQREYGVNLPIFCDNAESITRNIQADQQLIELFAKKGKKIEEVVPIETII